MKKDVLTFRPVPTSSNGFGILIAISFFASTYWAITWLPTQALDIAGFFILVLIHVAWVIALNKLPNVILIDAQAKTVTVITHSIFLGKKSQRIYKAGTFKSVVSCLHFVNKIFENHVGLIEDEHSLCIDLLVDVFPAGSDGDGFLAKATESPRAAALRAELATILNIADRGFVDKTFL